MMSYRRISFCAALAVLWSFVRISTFAQPVDTLKIGDHAPGIKGLAWVKGDPLVEFKPGEMSIVVYSGMGCGPCQAAIPMFNRIIDDNAAAKVKLMTVYQHQATDAHGFSDMQLRVRNFSGKMGCRYPVAVDAFDNTFEKVWLMGNRAMPQVFVVDRNGKIAWIGSPSDLEEALLRLLNNEDVAIVNASIAKRKAGLSEVVQSLPGVSEEKGFRTHLRTLDSLIVAYPDRAWLYHEKLRLLHRYDTAAANVLAWWMLDQHDPAFDTQMHHIGLTLANSAWRNYSLAIEAFQRRMETCDDPMLAYMSMRDISWAYGISGDIGAAIAAQRKAIEMLKNIGPAAAGYEKLLNESQTLLGRYEAQRTPTKGK